MVGSQEDGLRAVEFKTRDQAEEYLSRIAGCIRDVSFKTEQDYRIAYAGGVIGRCHLHRGSHSALSFSVVESDEVHALVPLRSGFRFNGNGISIDGSAQTAGLLMRPQSRGSIQTSDQFSGMSLVVAANAVAEHASAIVDPQKPIDLSLGDTKPLVLGEPLEGALARNMAHVFHEMMTLGQGSVGALAGATFDELLLSLLTAVVSCRVRQSFDRPVPAPNTSTVRRAQEIIREHAAEPIRLAELARSLGVGLRALQIAFRRQVGCSPRDFLMRCRIERARERLLSPNEHTTIASTAFECGFADLAHFSRRYRETFGELPSATLKRGK